jgi:hypothetical protein
MIGNNLIPTLLALLVHKQNEFTRLLELSLPGSIDKFETFFLSWKFIFTLMFWVERFNSSWANFLHHDINILYGKCSFQQG